MSGAGTDDERCVVKLLNNYRSHEDILQISSELFYDGVCCQLFAPSAHSVGQCAILVYKVDAAYIQENFGPVRTPLRQKACALGKSWTDPESMEMRRTSTRKKDDAP